MPTHTHTHMTDEGYRRIYPVDDDSHKLTLPNMAVKWLWPKFEQKRQKICRGRQLKKLIAVNDDINHKKMKSGAATISAKRQMKSQRA